MHTICFTGISNRSFFFCFLSWPMDYQTTNLHCLPGLVISADLNICGCCIRSMIWLTRTLPEWIELVTNTESSVNGWVTLIVCDSHFYIIVCLFSCLLFIRILWVRKKSPSCLITWIYSTDSILYQGSICSCFVCTFAFMIWLLL